jgi:UPF0042 nucleotide-binding protein
MDVRVLPNPYFVEELRSLDGRTRQVRDWVLRWPEAEGFVREYTDLLFKLLPQYINEGKRFLTIAIGCTGGKHRSVVIAEQVADKLRMKSYYIVLFHRDLHLE